MREAIGGTWIFSIVIVFIVLFTGYLAISVNYSKAFKVKNGIVNLIEKNEGLSSNTQKEIEDYLSDVGYNVYGKCSYDEEDGGINRQYLKSSDSVGDRYKYCVHISNPITGKGLPKTYFKITVFFRLDLPIVGNIFTFPVTGETKAIYFVDSAEMG